MVNHKIWNGTEKSAVSFPSCISTDAPFCSSCLPTRSFERMESPSRFHGSGGLWWIVATMGVHYRGRILPKCKMTGGGNLLSRSEYYQRVDCPVRTSFYRGRQLPKCRIIGMGSEPKLELQKGGYARSREGTVIGLDHRLGPIPRKCGRCQLLGCATRLWSLMGTSDHLCRI
jgi:hypothetical protein